MTIFVVETYVVKPENQAKIAPVFQKFMKLTEERKAKFKMVKSFKLYSQWIGAVGGYMDIWELKSLADFDVWCKSIEADDALMKAYLEWYSLIVPDSYNLHIWNNVMGHTFK